MISLPLTVFGYQDTDLCEPDDAELQTWLAGIGDLTGTEVTCGAQTVSGMVWDDLNRDGIQDAGEPGVEGATVTLTQNASAQAAADGRRTFTDAAGAYRFDYVAAGPHAIAVAKSGYLLTDPGPVQINVPAEGGLTVPPIGIAWLPAHIYLPLLHR